MIATDDAVELEAERLLRSLMHVECDPRGKTWNIDTCREIAPLTLEINRLKRERGAVILAHSYVEPEIIYGVADFLTGDDLRRLKALYPDATVVCYINSTADVKAESDVCVTSGNVYHIVEHLPGKRVLFVPDRLMGQNLRDELERRGVQKEIITSDGTCMVHDQFGPADIA